MIQYRRPPHSLGTDTSEFRPDTVKELVVTGGAWLFTPVVLRYVDSIVIGSGTPGIPLQLVCNLHPMLSFNAKQLPPVEHYVHWFKILRVDG